MRGRYDSIKRSQRERRIGVIIKRSRIGAGRREEKGEKEVERKVQFDLRERIRD